MLIADDQVLVREGFRMILDREPDVEVVAEAGDGREALQLASVHHPDVVLMDVRMPFLDGLEATRRLVEQPGHPRVLILTTFDRNEVVYEALKAGASGFLLKDVRRGQLTEAIRTVAAGEALLAPALTKRLIEEFVRRPPPDAGRPRALAALSPRELDVLCLMARGHSNTEIASILVLGETTIKSHVGRILGKLNVRDRVQAVVLAYETGLVRPGDAEAATRESRSREGP